MARACPYIYVYKYIYVYSWTDLNLCEFARACACVFVHKYICVYQWTDFPFCERTRVYACYKLVHFLNFKREPHPEVAVSIRKMVTFVTWPSSRTEFLV